MLHEQCGDPGSKEADEDVVVLHADASGVTLESGNVTFKRGGELSVFLSHVLDG